MGKACLLTVIKKLADTTLLDAPADAQEGTIQYLIEEARKAGSTTLALSLGENFPDTVEENLLIPHGMDVVLDLNGHTLTVDKTSAEDGKDTNDITVYGQLTLQNGSLSGSVSSLGNETYKRCICMLWRPSVSSERGQRSPAMLQQAEAAVCM